MKVLTPVLSLIIALSILSCSAENIQQIYRILFLQSGLSGWVITSNCF